jgi:hypothetical protein
MDTSSSSGRGPGRFNNLLYGIFVGAVLVGLVWTFTGTLRGSDGSSAAGGPVASDTEGAAGLVNAGSTPSPTNPYKTPSPTNSHDKQALRAEVLSDCRKVYHSQQSPLRAADTAMVQWQVHIGAMNQLVLGVISLPQATQFWNQTRVGASAHLHAFQKAVSKLSQPSTLCPAPPSATSSGALVRCEQAVAARFDELRAARVALGTWGMHVMHMEMLRDGKLTPQQATSLWLKNWHEGQQEVTRYRAASRAARAQSC